MKTLSKQQVEAIAAKILDENKPLKEDIERMTIRFKDIWERFQLSEDYRVLQKYKVRIYLSTATEDLFLNGFKYKPNYTHRSLLEIRIDDVNSIGVYSSGDKISREKLIQEIILAQMESPDLNTLIEKVRERCK